jgi:xanthine dehydrogenase small subunit
LKLIQFILNDTDIRTDLPSGVSVLDFVRYHKNLTGTKIGCREGDCGACVVLVGELKDNELIYQSFTSCLTPLGNVHGRHVVTIEGLNSHGLNLVQEAMQNQSATQCGFCSPGFVVSLAGFCLSKKEPTAQNAIASVDGNICRCTGYKSIERAASEIAKSMEDKDCDDPVTYVVQKGILPAYFSGIRERLRLLSFSANGIGKEQSSQYIGGGTDLYVQKHDEMRDTSMRLLSNDSSLKTIKNVEDKCIIGGAATVTDLWQSSIINQYFPKLDRYLKLVSSTPIRNIATIGGNFINASPIGDLTIFFLALDAKIILTDGINRRELSLKNFYRGYKNIDKHPEEFIEALWFQLPGRDTYFHFEKVSKRSYLDIASVNSAMAVKLKGQIVKEAHLSAGGVAPVPLYLAKASDYLKEKPMSEELIHEVIEVAQTEISPISDVRGTENYKRLLLSQLIKAHFISMFPKLDVAKLIAL